MYKNNIAKQLVKIAKELVSIEFATKQQLNKYLKQHPEANPKNHSVKENTSVSVNKSSEITKLQKFFGTSAKNIAQTTKDERVLDTLSKTQNIQTLFHVSRNQNTNENTLNDIVNSKHSNNYVKCVCLTNQNFNFNKLQEMSEYSFDSKDFDDETQDVLSEMATSILSGDVDRANEILNQQRYKK